MLPDIIRANVFLDRDGVICRNRSDYVKSWEEFEFLPGALEALARGTRAGLRLIVISNQSCIGRGIVDRETVDEINRRMQEEVARAGGHLAAVYICPHKIDEGCYCRKPRTALFREAAEDFGLFLEETFFVGDAESDMEAGRAIRARNVLVLTGLTDHRTVPRMDGELAPEHVSADLSDAVDWMIGQLDDGGERAN